MISWSTCEREFLFASLLILAIALGLFDLSSVLPLRHLWDALSSSTVEDSVVQSVPSTGDCPTPYSVDKINDF